MPPIKSQEAFEGPSPEEVIRRKTDLIQRVEYLASATEEIGVYPPVPDEDYAYYVLERTAEEKIGRADTLLKIREYDAANDEHRETPLVQFHRSVEVMPDDRVYGVTLRYPREIRVPVTKSERTEWVALEPGTHAYDNVEDTIAYIERYMRKVENSFVDRFVSKICSLIFTEAQQP